VIREQDKLSQLLFCPSRGLLSSAGNKSSLLDVALRSLTRCTLVAF